MALTTQSATIGGATKNLIVGTDTNGSIASGHVTVGSDGIEKGVSSNPLYVQQATALPAGSNVIGAVTVNGAVAVSGSFYQATQPVSFGALPAGGNTIGAVTIASGSAAIGTVGVTGTASIAGTVTANAGTGTFAVSAASLPLPTGAATAAKQPALGTAGTPSADVLSIQGTSTGTPLPVAGVGAVGATPSVAPQSIAGVDGSGNKQHVRTDTFGTPADAAWASGNGSMIALGKALVGAQQATTAAVLSSSIVPPSPSFTQTTAAASSLVLKASPGSLYACFVTTGTSGGYLMLFDANAPPANGAVTPKNVVYCPANGTTELEMPFLTAEPYSTGIVAVFSSTGPYTLTAASTAFIKGIAQ